MPTTTRIPESPERLKSLVREHWEEETCGTRLSSAPSREAFFEEITRARYELEPYIPDFADFEAANGKRVLEIGVGAGSDFERWIEAGAEAVGVDFSQAAVDLTRERLELHGLADRPHALHVADAERLPFPDDSFDLVYAWGVLHHTPDTRAAFREAFRVLKPEGTLRAMIYHVPSWTGWLLWTHHALLRGDPGMGVKEVLRRHLESVGTKAYTLDEARDMLTGMGYGKIRLSTRLTPADDLTVTPSRKYQHPVYRIALKLYPRWLVRRLGDRYGLALLIRARKPVRSRARAPRSGRRLRVCFVVDARSPIARNWIEHLVVEDHEVHVVSTYPCEFDLPVASFRVVPVGLARLTALSAPRRSEGGETSRLMRLRGGLVSSAASKIHYLIGPLDARRKASRLRSIVEEIGPDVVHAMRMPLEGILAGEAMRGSSIPLLVSIWGNDFTLFAKKYRWIEAGTRTALERADAVHADCRRDLELARQYGFHDERTAVVMPGNGGIHPEVFHPGDPDPALRLRLGIDASAPVVLNPRGFRVYVRNDTFFRAIPEVLERHPAVVFVGIEMEGNVVARQWIERLGIEDSIRLVSHVTRAEMAEMFRLADVVVSPSEHDGTPNTVLEAIACGAFPVVGDITSLREWIEDGHNGLLCDPGDPGSLAGAVVRALDDDGLRRRAARRNAAIIEERALFTTSMARAMELYGALADRARATVEEPAPLASE